MLFLLYIWLAISPFFLILSHVLVRGGIATGNPVKTYLGIIFGCLMGWILIIFWYLILINDQKKNLAKK